MLVGDVQELRELGTVGKRLIEHDHELGVGEHGARLHGIQQVFHILRDGGGITVALAELPPCGVEENAALFVFKHDMKFVDEDVGALALLPVESDTVEDGVGDHQQSRRLQLLAKAVNIEYDDALVEIDGAFVAENIQ